VFVLRPCSHLPRRFVRIGRRFGTVKIALVSESRATELRSD